MTCRSQIKTHQRASCAEEVYFPKQFTMRVLKAFKNSKVCSPCCWMQCPPSGKHVSHCLFSSLPPCLLSLPWCPMLCPPFHTSSPLDPFLVSLLHVLLVILFVWNLVEPFDIILEGRFHNMPQNFAVRYLYPTTVWGLWWCIFFSDQQLGGLGRPRKNKKSMNWLWVISSRCVTEELSIIWQFWRLCLLWRCKWLGESSWGSFDP